MKNILIASHPGTGKTHYAVDYYLEKIAIGMKGVFVSLEMSHADLMDKILKQKSEKNITFSDGGLKNLFITSLSSLNSIIEYIDNIHDTISFIIIDYLQLLEKNQDFETFFNYLKSKKLSLLMTTQITRGPEIEGQIFTELYLRIKEQNILKYFDEVKFLSKTLGIIEFKNE